MRKGTLVKVGDVDGYEDSKGIGGFVTHYNKGIGAFLVSLDRPIDGSYTFLF